MAERWGGAITCTGRAGGLARCASYFVVMVAFVASLVGNAFAQYMSPAPAGVGTFEDGYMYRHLFEIGAVAFILAAMLARRAFRAECAAYVRRLDANGEGDSHGDDAHEGCGRE